MKNTTSQLALIVLFAGAALVSLGQVSAGQSWEEIKKNKKGTLSVIYHTKPRLIQSEKNEMTGFSAAVLADFVEYVKQKYQVVLSIKYVADRPVFGEFLETIKNSQNILGLGNVTITDERRKFLAFTPTFLVMPPVLVTSKGASTITTPAQLKQLAKYTAVIVKGSSHAATVKKLDVDNNLQLTWSYGESSERILEMVDDQKQAMAIVDLIEYINTITKLQNIEAHKIKIAQPDQLGFIMSPKSDWLPLWEEFLTDEYRQSPRYRKLIQDNLGQAFLKLM